MTLAGTFLVDPISKNYLISPSIFKSLATLNHDGVITVQWYKKSGEPAHRHSFTYRSSNVGNKVWQEITENHRNHMHYILEVRTCK